MRILWLAGVLALFGAVPSAAIPLTYGFSAGGLHGDFSYDGDLGTCSVALEIVGYTLAPLDVGSTGLADFGVDSFGQPVLRLGGGSQRLGWPTVRDAFNVTAFEPAVVELWGDAVFDGANLRGGLSVADFSRARLLVQLFAIDLSASPYLFGCVEGTPLPDCPESSYPYRDSFKVQLDLTEMHQIAEPSPSWLALLAALVGLVAREMSRPDTK